MRDISVRLPGASGRTRRAARVCPTTRVATLVRGWRQRVLLLARSLHSLEFGDELCELFKAGEFNLG